MDIDSDGKLDILFKYTNVLNVHLKALLLYIYMYNESEHVKLNMIEIFLFILHMHTV